MKRIELIANRSVQDEVIDGLESAIPDFFYTLVPVVHGRGTQRRRLGSPTWPEENFLVIAYVDDEDARTVEAVIAEIKVRFPTEGIKLFTLSEKE
jgi:hypothetical protein